MQNRDRSVVPDTMISQAEVNVLVQRALGTYRRNQNNNSGNQSGSSSGTSFNNSNSTNPRNFSDKKLCRRCGKDDHLIKDCPQPQKINWKNKPPRSGQPQSKSVDGKEYHWCAKCQGVKGRWSPSHGTDKHITGNRPNQTSSNAECNIHEGLYCNWFDESEINVHEFSFDNRNTFDYITFYSLLWSVMNMLWFPHYIARSLLWCELILGWLYIELRDLFDYYIMPYYILVWLKYRYWQYLFVEYRAIYYFLMRIYIRTWYYQFLDYWNGTNICQYKRHATKRPRSCLRRTPYILGCLLSFPKDWRILSELQVLIR